MWPLLEYIQILFFPGFVGYTCRRVFLVYDGPKNGTADYHWKINNSAWVECLVSSFVTSGRDVSNFGTAQLSTKSKSTHGAPTIIIKLRLMTWRMQKLSRDPKVRVPISIDRIFAWLFFGVNSIKSLNKAELAEKHENNGTAQNIEFVRSKANSAKSKSNKIAIAARC